MTNKKCSVTDCNEELKAKGYCQTHYMRLRRHGHVGKIEKTKTICSVKGCRNLSEVKTFCMPHYQSWKTYGNPEKAKRKSAPPQCKVKDCKGINKGYGYCGKHYQRFKKYGSANDEVLKFAPRGSGSIDKHGYRIVVCPDWLGFGKNYRIPEHRLVMSEHLGRKLLPEETVHHINGIRTDNRLENLELWSSSHPAGQKVKDKLLWAHELIDLYEGQKAINKNGSKKE